MRFAPLPLSSISIQILTTCPTQEFVGQSHDQNQTFRLGQTSPRQNNVACRVYVPLQKGLLKRRILQLACSYNNSPFVMGNVTGLEYSWLSYIYLQFNKTMKQSSWIVTLFWRQLTKENNMHSNIIYYICNYTLCYFLYGLTYWLWRSQVLMFPSYRIIKFKSLMHLWY